MSFTGLSVGEHVFEVRAIDWSGNVDETPAEHRWTIQAPAPDQAPETTILTGPDATTVNTAATFTLDSDEEGVTYTCSIDGSDAACTSPVTFSGLAVGTHEFEVVATDVDGLTDPTPATWTWVVTAAPIATNVSCGQTITSSVRLTNDLTDCSGDGLVIGADAITIDLDGHTIDGIGLGTGVRNTGFDAVAVTGGTVTQFDDGILFAGGYGIVDAMTLVENQVTGVAVRGGAPGTVVRHTDVTASPTGVEISGGTSGATVSDATLSGIPGDGVLLDGATASTVTRTSVTGASQSGIALLGASGNTLTGNTLTSSSGPGISLDLASDDNLVRGNDVSDSGSDGISVTDSSGNDLLANVVTTSGGCGIALEGATDTLVASNDVRFNAGGICLTLSSGNTLERNTVAGTSGTGISLEGDSFANVVRLNTVSGSSGSGIEVAGAAPAGEGNLVAGQRRHRQQRGRHRRRRRRPHGDRQRRDPQRRLGHLRRAGNGRRWRQPGLGQRRAGAVPGRRVHHHRRRRVPRTRPSSTARPTRRTAPTPCSRSPAATTPHRRRPWASSAASTAPTSSTSSTATTRGS